MSNYKFKHNEAVAFSFGGTFGYGDIAGVATSEQPILGAYYIIDVKNSNRQLPNNEYPFTSIAMPEIGIVRLTLGGAIESGGVRIIPILHEGVELAFVKQKYIFALRMMPQPEKLELVHRLAEELYATGHFPHPILFEHLFALLRFTVEWV